MTDRNTFTSSVRTALCPGLGVVLLMSASPGCGTVRESWQETDLLDSGDPLADLAGDHDCEALNGLALDSYVARDLDIPELHIIGIREPRAPFAGPDGEVTIQIRRSGPVALVLSSFERAHWNVEIAADTVLDHVIINGYEPQEVTIDWSAVEPRPQFPPDPTVTSVNTVEDGDYLGFGYSWPTESELAGSCTEFYPADVCDRLGASWQADLQRQSDELSRLVRSAEALTNRTLSTFHGCYHLSRFELLP